MQDVVEHFKNLLRINTSNPPGNEEQALKYLKTHLDLAGIETHIQTTAPGRGNLVARIKGDGSRKPMHIHSHVDVVHAEPEFWKHDPFSAAEDDGCIYGRGAVDMKNFTAFCLSVMLKAKKEGWRLKRDLIMSAVSDEEAGGRWGMEALVREYPEWVRAEYSLGEVGGYTTYFGNKPAYPIQVGEKGTFWIEASFRGEPGHGSIPGPQNVHWRYQRFLQKLESEAFPFHPTNSYLAFVDGMASLQSPLVKLLKTPLAPKLLKPIIRKTQSSKLAALLAMMTNTANPTGVQSGKQHNVVPSVLTFKLDCRLIPGQTGEDVIQEIESITGEKLDYRVVVSNPGHESPIATPLYDLIKEKVERAHPGSQALPWLTVGYTDASQLNKLGNKCYGFTPLKLPPDMDFTKLYHGHNERVPVEGFLWGARLFEDLIREFCQI